MFIDREGLAQKVEFNSVLACEAGESIKPGALAPGQRDETDQARETGESADFQTFARFAGCTRNGSLPGADAPGYMLSPASQAKEPFEIYFLCKAGRERPVNQALL